MAEFVPWALTEPSRWGGDYNIELTSITRRRKHQDEYVADVDSWLAGTKQLQTWPSGELPAPVIDALVTAERPATPGQHPEHRAGVRCPAGAVVESMCVVDGEGIRGRDAPPSRPRSQSWCGGTPRSPS